jgi:hypothetical protein
MICNGVGVGLMLDPEGGEVCVVLSLFHNEDETRDEAEYIRLTPERSAAVGLDLLARAAAGQEILTEITNTPMDDRPAVIAKIVARLHGGFN